MCYSSITIAPMPCTAARAAAEKRLQDIYKVALNQATFKTLTAFIAQAKLVIKEIYQAHLAAIKKNPTIINIVETNSGEFFFLFTAKSLDLLFSEILISKVAAIQKGIFILKNFVKLYNNLFRINSNQIKLTADRKVITFSKGFRKDFSSIGIQLKGFTNYSIII